MHLIYAFTALAGFLTVALANNDCHHDNCYRAIKQYGSVSTSFCKQYLATPYAPLLHPIDKKKTYIESKHSTKQAPTPFATCGPSVPHISFPVAPTVEVSTDPRLQRISSACNCLKTQAPNCPTQTTAATTTSASRTSSFVTSTCSRSSASACPTSVNPCCQYRCAVAQVPFQVCSPSDTSGQFEVCSKCPVPTAA